MQPLVVLLRISKGLTNNVLVRGDLPFSVFGLESAATELPVDTRGRALAESGCGFAMHR